MTFKEDGYVHVKKFLSEGICQLATQYIFFKRMNDVCNIGLQGEDDEVPGSYYYITDALTETFLQFLLPIAQEKTGLNLFPTYSSCRIYQPGNIVEPLKLNMDSEITGVVNLAYRYTEVNDDYKWPMIIDNKPVVLEQGDFFIYKGFDTYYERKKFDVGKDSFHVQLILNYVDADNPHNKERRFAGRENIGMDFNLLVKNYDSEDIEDNENQEIEKINKINEDNENQEIEKINKINEDNENQEIEKIHKINFYKINEDNENQEIEKIPRINFHKINEGNEHQETEKNT